ncbi:hypothetical protein AQUCO_00300044v1 [Aquilegia coerulea]|uniref:glucan endo-1,3-beta-D-glucosidase n=1 Tax=Aquilegia coerulea TaxID=218851 RepID=A0A2G5EX01_AQUCA|nr:hypothetical protein AQUCO_00300044v1 [Aquilegia coerulea]
MAKSPTNLIPILFFLFHILQISTAQTIGVNYGTLGNNLASPGQVVAFLKEKTIIDRVKIFDANPDILGAFANSGIAVTVAVANNEIAQLTQLAGARSWVDTHIVPFHPKTRINRILVGNEVLHSLDNTLISNLVPAMKTLHAALLQAGIKDVQVSTAHSLGFLLRSQPPSTGQFRPGWDTGVLAPMLQFHRETKSAFVVNPYPYFGYSQRLENYALFKPNRGRFDRYTKITYMNMFDAQLDAVYSAMKRLGYGDVEIAVGETGWPSVGEPGQLGVSLDTAATYNGMLVKHVNSGKGTPLMPGRRFETYIFGLFNENTKPGPTAERNFGLFWPDFTPVYNAGVLRGQTFGGVPATVPLPPRRGGKAGRGGHAQNPKVAPANAGKNWCLPRQGVTDTDLQKNIDYVCSLGIDCKPIQDGGACFNPSTIRSHAAYAMNAYYQSRGPQAVNCDFTKTGEVVTKDPSYGTCKY